MGAETLRRSGYHHLDQPGSMVLLGGWRRSRSWVTTMAFLLLVLFLVLIPLVSGFDKEPGLLELGLLAKYPEYQAVLKFKKRNGGGLNFKRNGGVPDECRGKYDTSIYTQLDNICEDCYNLYKEADVHQFCRADCFSTSYFQRCLQALLLEEDRFLNMVQIIGKKKR